MPKISKPSTKKPTAKTKKVAAVVKKATKVIKKNSTPEIKVKAPIKISKTYIPKETEKYMCDKHLSFFKIKLTEWKKELVKANNEILNLLNQSTSKILNYEEALLRIDLGWIPYIYPGLSAQIRRIDRY